MSYRRIREFLHDWLGLSLSVGTLNRTLHEAAAASAPLEKELIKAVVASDLLHADETSWPQGGELLWLWVFTSATVTLFVVGQARARDPRSILPGFTGWLMSDGWQAYRHFPQRLRCWAHLTRKAQGLIDSCEREAQAFGHQVQDTFDTLDRRHPCRARRPAGRFADPPCRVAGRAACRLRASARAPSRQDARLGRGTLERLGGHLSGAGAIPSGRSPTTRPSGPCAIGSSRAAS
jgi:hypothetical protein